MTRKNDSILVVEDNPTNMGVLVDYLSQQGFDIHVAEDGESALELLNYTSPDIILLDVMMPRMDGFEVCLHLKSAPETRDIPVIFMTSLDEISEKVKGFEMGAVDYITKPIQHEELLARLNTHISLRNLQRRLQEKNALLEEEINERKKLQDALEHLVITDALTGIYNRRHLFNLAESEIARSKRYQRPLGIIMIDIDHFKVVNDNYGHLTGDQVLFYMARRVKGELRAHDFVGRYGGEEFAVVLPETDLQSTVHVAERLRERVAEEAFRTDKEKIHLTISLGVNCLNGEQDMSVERLLDEADQALYQAKRLGRNRTEVFRPVKVSKADEVD
jgi:diguanylate cyclase (GGDEF)-like protein